MSDYLKFAQKPEEHIKYLELKAKGDVDGLLALLQVCRQKEDPRRQIMATLGEIGGARAVDTLISILNDVNDHTYQFRHDAARALAKIRDRRAVEPLISALEDDDGDLRIVVAEALGIFRDTRAVEPLIAKIDDSHARWRNDTEYDTIETTVGSTAVDSLRKITSQNFDKDATAWQQWWTKKNSSPKTIEEKSVEFVRDSKVEHTKAEPSNKGGCQPWLAGISILIGVLLSIVGGCLGLVTIYGQVSGTSGDSGNMTSFLAAIGCFALPPVIIGLALIGFGIYTQRNRRKKMISSN